jgi:hypothetical protein
VKLPGPVAAVVSKAVALEDLDPRLYGAVLVFAAAALIASGLQSDGRRLDHDGAEAR